MDPLTVLLVLAVIAGAAWERRQQNTTVRAEREAWRTERAELLERIQRPDIPPRPHVPRRHTEQDREHAERQARMQAQLARVGHAAPLRDLSERPAPDEAA